MFSDLGKNKGTHCLEIYFHALGNSSIFMYFCLKQCCMICFPNAKINLGLHIVSRRSDRYHNLETIFYPIGMRDALEIIPTPEGEYPASGQKFRFFKQGT